MAGRFAISHLLVLLAVAACGGDVEPPAPAPGFDAPPIPVTGPDVRIGSIDGENDAFQRITALAEAPDGRLFSAHSREGLVRIWSARGEFLGTLGRRGGGPGEFTNLQEIGFFGDTLWAWDPSGRRVTRFDADGELVSTVAGRAQSTSRWGALRVRAPLRNGSFLAQQSTPATDLIQGEITETAFVHVAPDGAVLNEIARRDQRLSDQFTFTLAGETMYGTPMIRDLMLEVVTARGLVTVDRRAWTGDGTPGVTVLLRGFNGDTLAHHDVAYEPVALDDELFSELIDEAVGPMFELVGNFGTGGTVGQLREQYEQNSYRPAYLPAVEDLVVAADGSVWLRATDETVDRPTWWILSPDLEPVQRVHTPEGFRLQAVRGDRLWGSETDDFDIPYIVRYRLPAGADGR